MPPRANPRATAERFARSPTSVFTCGVAFPPANSARRGEREARMGARQVRSVVGERWVLYLLGGVLVVGAYYLATHLGAPPVIQVALYCFVSVSSAAAVLFGCWLGLSRGKPRVPWLFLGFSQVVYAVADMFFYVSHNLLGPTAFPAVADALYLLHYPLVVAGLTLLIMRRSPRHT